MLSSTPPPQFIRDMAEMKTSSPKKEKKKIEIIGGKKAPISSAPASSTPPKFSKAARRYYNQNFRELQRLNKALATAGGFFLYREYPSLTSYIKSFSDVYFNAFFYHLVASRRKSDELIFDGKVTVNGSVCKFPQVAFSTRQFHQIISDS